MSVLSPWLLALTVLFAPAEVTLTIPTAVQALQRGARLEIAGERICAENPLPLFYTRRNFQIAWNDANRSAMLASIRNAVSDGLDPSDYHVHAIEEETDPVRRDLLLSDAFFLLASHLLSGRIDPVTIEPTWCLEPRTSDLVPALENALNAGEVAATLAVFRPAHRGYFLLREQLARYRRMTDWPRIDNGRSIRGGDATPRGSQLIARLAAEGELTGVHGMVDAAVVDAVKRFQVAHGLEPDGVAGVRTIREMNVTRAERVRQLEINLERWRWLPITLGSRYMMINLPQFQLSVVENTKTALTMRIVAGKDFEHRTPVFSSDIKEIVFSPYWNVPDSIASKELWPKQARDRTYLAREHIEVVAGDKLRQTPGPWNALGRLKFNMPNAYAVYLHDTPARDLFNRAVRTFSHGCIRIELPVDLAVYLLRDQPGWTRDTIIAESQTGKEHAVKVRAPLPVHVLYWTAFTDDAGRLRFAPDVYGRDPVLDSAMRKPAPRF